MENASVDTQSPGVKLKQKTAARLLVALYNTQAAVLAETVLELWQLRTAMGESGAGQVIISADGWMGNALESIPLLKVEGEDYPKHLPAGMLIDLRKQAAASHFNAPEPASFAMPEGYTATAESMAHHKAALNYAEQNGIDYITAAIEIEKKGVRHDTQRC